MSKKAKTPKAKKTKTPKAPKTSFEAIQKKCSCLDAAAAVLKDSTVPMNAKDIIAKAAEKGLWTSGAGKTPHMTLFSGIIREIEKKGADSRFRKIDRGLFAHA